MAVGSVVCPLLYTGHWQAHRLLAERVARPILLDQSHFAQNVRRLLLALRDDGSCGIGQSLYSGLTFVDGGPDQKNFDKYRMIRHREAPKTIDVHFVQNEIDPKRLGEPPFPPVIGALANALYKATGKRHYQQPFLAEGITMG